VLVIRLKSKRRASLLQGFKNIVEANAGVVTPAWMESDVETLTGTVKELPLREQIDVPVNDTHRRVVLEVIRVSKGFVAK